MTITIKDIFNKQRELMERYEDIEKDNGFRQPFSIPVDINDKHDQHRLKDFAWRITEEVAEAMEQFLKGNWEAGREELADVLHFLSEFTILAGREDIVEKLIKNFVVPTVQDPQFIQQYGFLTYNLSMTMHELKNKPWKQSYRMTDEVEFDKYFEQTWDTFIVLCYHAGLNIGGLFEEYMAKHKENVKRQKSGY